jgi:hypothetical protein
VFHYQANCRAAKHLVMRLIEAGFEVAYAYEPRHEAMPHAILNTLLFLDWDRHGFALGTMAALGGRKPQEARFVVSWITNANKVFAVFRP